MSVRNPFEEIKRIIHDQTNRVDQVVSNLHGVVEEKRIVREEQVGQDWYILTAFTQRMPTLFEFADAYAEEVPGYIEKQGSGGVVRFPDRGVVQPGRAVLFYTTVRLSGPVPIPIKVDAPGYEIAIYVDKNRIKSGRESLGVSPTLNPGTHNLAIVLFGGLNTIRVQIPPGIETVKQEPMPEAPIWYTRPENIYLNAQVGSMVNRLQWNNDPFASAWQVYRAETEEVAEITQEPTDNGDGTFTIHFDDLELDVSVGEDFYTKHFYAGRVVNVETGVAEDNKPYTRITIRLSLEAPVDPAEWVAEYYMRPGDLQSLARVTYSGNDTIQWDDTDVKYGRVYVYALTAFGIINQSTESDYSKLEWALSTDETPPGPITVEEIVVSRDQVYVTFTAPEDEDYYGVRVYGPYAQGEVVEFNATKRVKVEYGESGERDQLTFKAPNLGEYYLVSFDVVGNQQEVADAYKFTYNGPDYNNVPTIVVTPGAPTATHLPVSWAADADEVSVVASGTTLEFYQGDATSAQGQLRATRPVAGAPKGTVTFTVTKYGITIIDSVDVPPVDVNVVCPDLEVTQEEADGLKVRYSAVATNPAGGGTPQMEVELVDCEAFHYDSSGEPTQYSHGDKIPFAATDALVVIRPPVGVTTARAIFRAWNQGVNGSAQVVKIFEIFEAPIGDRQREPLTASILLDADPDPNDPEVTWHISISVLPTTADVTAKVNGEPVQLTPGAEEGQYTYVLTRSYAQDQKLVVHASGPGILPATASFVLDRDDEPELSSVSVSYRSDRAVITAIADDDALRLRFGRVNEDQTITYFPDVTGEDVSGNGPNGKTAVLEVMYATGESPDYFIEVTDDPAGLLRWRVVWKQRVVNPTAGAGAPPQIQIYVLQPTGGQWDERYEVRVQIDAVNPSGAGVDLYYKIGAVQDPQNDDQGWTFVQVGERPKTLIFFRDQANHNEKHILRVRAVNQDNGLEDMDIFTVDFDSDPQLASIDVYPRFAATQEEIEQGGFRNRIVGWAVSGTADDDTRSVKIEVTGSLKIVNPVDQSEITTLVVTTVSDKTFDVDLNQEIGGFGELVVTPYSEAGAGGVAGKPYRTKLSRSPVSQAMLRDISQTEVEVTISAIPDTANIYYRVYRDGDTPGAWVQYTEPFIFIRSANRDVVVEYYAELAGATPEDPHKLIVDPDDDAEVVIDSVRESPAGVLVVSVTTDDDVMIWRLWSRKGAWPTADGTLNSQPNDAYMRYEGDRLTTVVQHRATAGTWYVIARGYDASGRPANMSSTQITIEGDGEGGGSVTTPQPALTKVGVTLIQEGVNYYHYVYWHHNDLLEQDFNGAKKFVIAVQRNFLFGTGETLIPITDDRHPAVERVVLQPGNIYTDLNQTPNFGSVRVEQVTPVDKYHPNAMYLTYRYRVTLWENVGGPAPVLRGTYEAQFSGYYDVPIWIDLNL